MQKTKTAPSESNLNEKEPTMTAPMAELSLKSKPFFIGVSGGTASGKKEICQAIMDKINAVNHNGLKCVHIKMEDFYVTLGERELVLAQEGEYNFDHPDAVDLELLKNCLVQLMNGKSTQIPVYDFANLKRALETTTVDAPDVIIVSGTLIFYEKELRDLCDLKVFADVDSDTRLARAVIRDTTSRYNKTLDQVLYGYSRFVKPSFEEFVLPTKRFADVVIPRGDENEVAIELLSEHITGLLSQ